MVHQWAKAPLSVFDIGCGTANYWEFFPKSCFVSGVEKSREMREASKYKERIIQADILNIINLEFERKYDCATALFDVINYIPVHNWWKSLPIKKGDYFIFDIWDKAKVDREGFRETLKRKDAISRRIIPSNYDGKTVDLRVEVRDGDITFSEEHRMYVYSHKEIEKFCGDDFEIVEVKPTTGWQCWYKLIKS